MHPVVKWHDPDRAASPEMLIAIGLDRDIAARNDQADAWKRRP